MIQKLNESLTEDIAFDYLKDLGYTTLLGPGIAPDGERQERENYHEVILKQRLRDAIDRLNKHLPKDAREEAFRIATKTDSPDLIVNNRAFHNLLINGVDVEYREKDQIKYNKAVLINYNDISKNDFLAVRQYTVIENNHNRRADVVLFVNGLPVVVIELKNPTDEDATIWSAYDQLQTYMMQVPSLFTTNAFLITSDGLEARAGTITSPAERFLAWKTIDGEDVEPLGVPQMKVLFMGMLRKEILLDLIRHFIVFEDDGPKIMKKMAAYHQYHAVNKAIMRTREATSPKGDKRCGVIWHTQGSGKSLLMVFYTGKLVLSLDNPTIVMLTDRNDLDDQLFGTFSNCNDLLRQLPRQADSRDHLKELLSVASGGIIFTTIHKFAPDQKGGKYPLLSDRRNIIVIADEAHRSQYDFIDGFARHLRDALPNASFIGFTGTPIEHSDKSTPAVFGNYIDIYDITQAVRDGTTVRIYYESRLVRLEIDEAVRETLNEDFDEVTEGEEESSREKLKSKWARLEAVVGSESRIKKLAGDIVAHFEERQRAIEGKAMIVCMSRRICIDLHNEIVKLRPEWYHKDDDKGIIKVIMTGSASDPKEWQEHIRTKERRKDIGDNLKDETHPLKLVFVRDMWLTGFDAPVLNTMYVDKPMRGHGLMQAIARVNRVFKDKDGGLVVDYIGIADELKKALSEYTESDRTNTGIDKEEAVALCLEKYEIVLGLFHGFEYKRYFISGVKKLEIIQEAIAHIIEQEDGIDRLIKYVNELSKAFALAVPNEKVVQINDEVAFFQAVRAGVSKFSRGNGNPRDMDSALRQIISKAVVSEDIIDIFDAAGIKKPDISILSDEFLAEVRGMKHKNLALELLKKLINDEIKTRKKINIVQARSFLEMLESSIRKLQNKAIETAEIIEELISLAKEIRESDKRGENLGLTFDELAFYDALANNDSAKEVMGDKTLCDLARELIRLVRQNISIDWSVRENVRAKLRVIIKRLLKKYGYPPDMQKMATDLVIEQAEKLSEMWVAD